jgi:hypothetical protein
MGASRRPPIWGTWTHSIRLSRPAIGRYSVGGVPGIPWSPTRPGPLRLGPCGLGMRAYGRRGFRAAGSTAPSCGLQFGPGRTLDVDRGPASPGRHPGPCGPGCRGSVGAVRPTTPATKGPLRAPHAVRFTLPTTAPRGAGCRGSAGPVGPSGAWPGPGEDAPGDTPWCPARTTRVRAVLDSSGAPAGPVLPMTDGPWSQGPDRGRRPFGR